MQRIPMASVQQSRIQSYLEKNKIGPLFEVCATTFSPQKMLVRHLEILLH